MKKEPTLNFGDILNGTERESNAIKFLAGLVGDDGGRGLDTLEGWCLRLKKKIDRLEMNNALHIEIE